MRRPRITRALVLVLAIGLALARATAADDADAGFRVIVHPDNPIVSVDRAFLREAFLKKATDWGDGKTIRPVDLASVRERFARAVLKKTPSQLKNYWNQQIFSGKGVPPPEASSADAVIAYVLANPGAIGYLPAGVDPRRAKVIEVK